MGLTILHLAKPHLPHTLAKAGNLRLDKIKLEYAYLRYPCARVMLLLSVIVMGGIAAGRPRKQFTSQNPQMLPSQ